MEGFVVSVRAACLQPAQLHHVAAAIPCPGDDRADLVRGLAQRMVEKWTYRCVDLALVCPKSLPTTCKVRPPLSPADA